MKKLLILAALATVPVSQPAVAEPAFRSAVVQHSDLDLRTEAGAKTLDRRIWRAVATVCGTAPDYDLEGKNEVRECRRDTRRVASTHASQAIADAARNQPIRITAIQK